MYDFYNPLDELLMILEEYYDDNPAFNFPQDRIDSGFIKDWCFRNLSPGKFSRYLNLSNSQRKVFEEEFMRRFEGLEAELEKKAREMYLDDGAMSSELEGDWEVNRREHAGPGLTVVNKLCLCPFHIQNGDEEYLEMLKFWSERGLPWVASNYFSHYNRAAWNEENDSLVRAVKERRRHPENYDQLLLGVPLT